jgi:hypothetical protein
MWFRKQKAEKEERRGRKNQEAQRSKEELSSLEKRNTISGCWQKNMRNMSGKPLFVHEKAPSN